MPKKSLLPFILLGSGIAWLTIFEWLRQRRRQRSEPGAGPAEQQLTWIGIAGLLIFMVAAAVAAYLKWFP